MLQKRSAMVVARPFGTLPDGTSIDACVLRNDSIELEAITWGCIITALRVAGRNGEWLNVVLGYDRLEPYLSNPAYLGAVAGRYANRIAYGRLPLEGTDHQLTCNDGVHHLHGGIRGFDQHVWTATTVEGADASGVTFTRTSPAGEEGYPGAAHVRVTYLVRSDASVAIEYAVTSDAPTVVNLTQHSYFNLGGRGEATVLGHELTIAADSFLPVDAQLIPTGASAEVDRTPFDFRRSAQIGERLQHDHEQLRLAGGFDHNFVLSRAGGSVNPVATLRSPSSGCTLEIATTEPGLQLYTGQQLDGRRVSAGGRILGAHAGVCLETQHFPDSPHHARFPSTVVRPGLPYASHTTWTFNVT